MFMNKSVNEQGRDDRDRNPQDKITIRISLEKCMVCFFEEQEEENRK